MRKNKTICSQCKALFYPMNLPICGSCDRPFCPNCNACTCNTVKSYIAPKKRVLSNLQEIELFNENQMIEVNATLSPLIGQIPIQTQQGTILKTEFELLDDNQKIPLIIWGPVPEKLFPFRYEYTNLIISGVKKQTFNGRTVLIASKSTKYFTNNLRTKSLEYFISESSY